MTAASAGLGCAGVIGSVVAEAGGTSGSACWSLGEGVCGTEESCSEGGKYEACFKHGKYVSKRVG